MPTIIQRMKPSKKWAIATVVLVALAIIIAIPLAYVRIRDQITLQKYRDTLSQAAEFDHAMHYADETRVLLDYVKSNPPNKYQYQPYMLLGNLAYDDRKDSDAVKYYKAAVAANGGKLTLIDAESIAQAAASGGDKSTAVEYYRQAIKLTVVQSNVGNNIDEYKMAIKNLGGTP